MSAERYMSSWEADPQLSGWLMQSTRSGAAYCRWCRRELTAKLAHLRRHAQTTLHKTNELTRCGLLVPSKRRRKLRAKYRSMDCDRPPTLSPPDGVDVSSAEASQRCFVDVQCPPATRCFLCKARWQRERQAAVSSRYTSTDADQCVDGRQHAATLPPSSSCFDGWTDVLQQSSELFPRSLLVSRLARIVCWPLDESLRRHGSMMCGRCVELVNLADQLQHKLNNVQAQIRLRFNLPCHMDDSFSDVTTASTHPSVTNCADSEASKCDNSDAVVDTDTRRYEIVCVDCDSASQTPQNLPAAERLTSYEGKLAEGPDGVMFMWQDGDLVPVNNKMAHQIQTKVEADMDGCHDDEPSVNIVITDQNTVTTNNAVVTSKSPIVERPSTCVRSRSLTSQAQFKRSPLDGAARRRISRSVYQRKRGPDFIARYQAKDSKLTCRLCKFVASTNMVLHKHWNQSHPDKLLPCPCCEKKFFYRTSLNKHMHIHQGPSYFCELCNHPFVNRRDLHRHHLFRHTDIKQFVCMECGHGFKMKFMLKRHLKSVHGISQAVV